MEGETRSRTHIKGASLLARLEFVKERGGPDLMRRVLARLSPPDRALVEGRILAASFFPLDLNQRLDEAIAHAVNPLDPSGVYRELGRASAEKNLAKIHQIFLREKTPHAVLEGFPAVRATYYTDGAAHYARTGETSGSLSVEGASYHSQADCESTAGYFERALELAGAKDVKVTLALCRGRGDRRCELACVWR